MAKKKATKKPKKVQRIFEYIHRAKDGRMTLRWLEPNEGKEPDERTLRSYDAPADRFLAALDKLCATALSVMECPKQWVEDSRLVSITIRRQDGSVKSVTLSALRRLQNANQPLVLNTHPVAWDELAAPARNKIESVCTEADAYIDGERKTDSLFSDGRDSARSKESANDAEADPEPVTAQETAGAAT